MLQATDRVVAKIAFSVIRNIFRDTKISTMDGALLLASYTSKVVKGNKELMMAVAELLRETSEEERAEMEGRANSIINRDQAFLDS